MNKLLVIISLFLSCYSVASSEQDGDTNKENAVAWAKTQAEDIQHFVSDQEIKILKTEADAFIALLQKETTGFPRGVALIVPDINQSIFQQAAISSIYSNLNDYGWTNLLLTMPNDLNPVFGFKEETTNNTTEQQSETTAQEANNISEKEMSTPEQQSGNLVNMPKMKAFHQNNYYSEKQSMDIATQIKHRMNSAWELAEEYPGFFLIICQGKSCAWLAELFLKDNLSQPDAMIMLSAHMPQADLNQKLAMQISQLEFPILDMYQDIDNPWVSANIKLRRNMARTHYKTNYRQRKLIAGIGFYGQEQRTIKEIYGFLTAVGM